ncbi:hypothetical protein AAG906_025256 [Vitis piasezkii]
MTTILRTGFRDSVNEELFECANPSPLYLKPTYVPSREEMSELLSCIPSFTKREPSVHDIRVFFLVTQRILVEMDKDPNQSFMVRFPHDTSNTAIARIMNMNDYTTFETAEMVEDEKEASQTEARWLVEDKTTMKTEKEKTKEETIRLRNMTLLTILSTSLLMMRTMNILDNPTLRDRPVPRD